MGLFFQVDGKQLGQQYKDHLSDYNIWDQKEHAEGWLLFHGNTGTSLSIDETALSNGELYTIVTNKAAKEMKERIGTLVENSQGIWMGTFHSVFARILRLEASLLGYPSYFTIYDQQDSESLIKKIIEKYLI